VIICDVLIEINEAAWYLKVLGDERGDCRNALGTEGITLSQQYERF
jgi:hypothetical protein